MRPLADLRGHGLGVHSRRDPLGHPHDQAQVLEVGSHRRIDTGVLHLHGHVAPVVAQARAVDLPDRGGGHRLLVELGEDRAELLAEVVLHDLAHLREGHPRRGVAQLGELGLDALPELGRERARVDERGHLPHLHRRALHLAEHVEDLLGRLHLPRRSAAARRPSSPRARLAALVA